MNMNENQILTEFCRVLSASSTESGNGMNPQANLVWPLSAQTFDALLSLWETKICGQGESHAARCKVEFCAPIFCSHTLGGRGMMRVCASFGSMEDLLHFVTPQILVLGCKALAQMSSSSSRGSCVLGGGGELWSWGKLCFWRRTVSCYRKYTWHVCLQYTFPKELYGRKRGKQDVQKETQTPNPNSLTICPHVAVCVCACVCACKCIFLCVCIRRMEGDPKYLPLSSSSFLRRRSLTESKAYCSAYPGHPEAVGSTCHYPFNGGLQACTIVSSFLGGCWEPHSRPSYPASYLHSLHFTTYLVVFRIFCVLFIVSDSCLAYN